MSKIQVIKGKNMRLKLRYKTRTRITNTTAN